MNMTIQRPIMRFSNYLNETMMRSNRRGGLPPFEEAKYEAWAKDLMIDAYGHVDPEKLKDKFKRDFAKKHKLDPKLFIQIYDRMIKNGEWKRIRKEEFME